MKGRKPQDLAMRLLSGNAGKRPIRGSAEADPFLREELTRPSGLSALEDQEWTRLSETLSPILSRASEGMLLVAVQSYAQMMDADKVIREQGLTYQTCGESGVVIRMRPEVRIRDAARTAYFRALTELGGSPVSQVRTKKLPEKKTAKEKATGSARFFTS